MTRLTHQAIRERCLTIRNQLNVETQSQCSNKVCRRIITLKQYQNAHQIALFYAFNGEVDLTEVWHHALSQGKQCYFPVIIEPTLLLFLPVTTTTTFLPNQYGILEPQVDPQLAISPEDLEVIFTPLVAFDKHGTRVGMGKGFYDHTLADSRPKWLLGVGYEFQKEPFIEPNPWDIPLDAIITEKKLYWSLP